MLVHGVTVKYRRGPVAFANVNKSRIFIAGFRFAFFDGSRKNDYQNAARRDTDTPK